MSSNLDSLTYFLRKGRYDKSLPLLKGLSYEIRVIHSFQEDSGAEVAGGTVYTLAKNSV